MKYLALVVMLMACGQPEKNTNLVESAEVQSNVEVKQEPMKAMMVAGVKPDCTIDNENQLIYAIDESLFYTCKSEAWAEIDLKGKDGANGIDGKDGNVATAIIQKIWNYKLPSNNKDSLPSLYSASGATLRLNYAQIILYSNGFYQVTTQFQDCMYGCNNLTQTFSKKITQKNHEFQLRGNGDYLIYTVDLDQDGNLSHFIINPMGNLKNNSIEYPMYEDL